MISAALIELIEVHANHLAGDVARDLGMSENAVYIAKCRVLRRLRRELAGLVD